MRPSIFFHHGCSAAGAFVRTLKASTACATTTGSVNRKVAPEPGSLSIHIFPFCRCTSAFAMDSPRPVPPTCDSPEAICANFSKTRFCSSLGMPGPVSVTAYSKVDAPSVRRVAAWIRQHLKRQI